MLFNTWKCLLLNTLVSTFFINIKNALCITLNDLFVIQKPDIFYLKKLIIRNEYICFIMKYFSQIQFYIIEFGNVYYMLLFF
jgi:hypothetical protein